ncbi:unnamed protein product [Amoebophrya sp. A120]|nr:unnamed protein product [Amoebophrya sp. A120]|eukprot:GSA120T00015704001.1
MATASRSTRLRQDRRSWTIATGTAMMLVLSLAAQPYTDLLFAAAVVMVPLRNAKMVCLSGRRAGDAGHDVLPRHQITRQPVSAAQEPDTTRPLWSSFVLTSFASDLYKAMQRTDGEQIKNPFTTMMKRNHIHNEKYEYRVPKLIFFFRHYDSWENGILRIVLNNWKPRKNIGDCASTTSTGKKNTKLKNKSSSTTPTPSIGVHQKQKFLLMDLIKVLHLQSRQISVKTSGVATTPSATPTSAEEATGRGPTSAAQGTNRAEATGRGPTSAAIECSSCDPASSVSVSSTSLTTPSAGSSFSAGPAQLAPPATTDNSSSFPVLSNNGEPQLRAYLLRKVQKLFADSGNPVSERDMAAKRLKLVEYHPDNFALHYVKEGGRGSSDGAHSSSLEVVDKDTGREAARSAVQQSSTTTPLTTTPAASSSSSASPVVSSRGQNNQELFSQGCTTAATATASTCMTPEEREDHAEGAQELKARLLLTFMDFFSTGAPADSCSEDDFALEQHERRDDRDLLLPEADAARTRTGEPRDDERPIALHADDDEMEMGTASNLSFRGRTNIIQHELMYVAWLAGLLIPKVDVVVKNDGSGRAQEQHATPDAAAPGIVGDPYRSNFLAELAKYEQRAEEESNVAGGKITPPATQQQQQARVAARVRELQETLERIADDAERQGSRNSAGKNYEAVDHSGKFREHRVMIEDHWDSIEEMMGPDGALTEYFLTALLNKKRAPEKLQLLVITCQMTLATVTKWVRGWQRLFPQELDEGDFEFLSDEGLEEVVVPEDSISQQDSCGESSPSADDAASFSMDSGDEELSGMGRQEDALDQRTERDQEEPVDEVLCPAWSSRQRRLKRDRERQKSAENSTRFKQYFFREVEVAGVKNSKIRRRKGRSSSGVELQQNEKTNSSCSDADSSRPSVFSEVDYTSEQDVAFLSGPRRASEDDVEDYQDLHKMKINADGTTASSAAGARTIKSTSRSRSRSSRRRSASARSRTEQMKERPESATPEKLARKNRKRQWKNSSSSSPKSKTNRRRVAPPQKKIKRVPLQKRFVKVTLNENTEVIFLLTESSIHWGSFEVGNGSCALREVDRRWGGARRQELRGASTGPAAVQLEEAQVVRNRSSPEVDHLRVAPSCRRPRSQPEAAHDDPAPVHFYGGARSCESTSPCAPFPYARSSCHVLSLAPHGDEHRAFLPAPREPGSSCHAPQHPRRKNTKKGGPRREDDPSLVPLLAATRKEIGHPNPLQLETETILSWLRGGDEFN